MVRVKDLSNNWLILLDLNYQNLRCSLLILAISLVISSSPGHRICPDKHFNIHQNCFPWLNCSEIPNIEILENIGYGTLKNVFKSSWRGQLVALSILKHKKYIHDFNNGLNMLKLLSGNPNVVQLVGFCEYSNIIVTQYHAYNNALNLKYLIKDSASALKLCLNYAELLKDFHESHFGKIVNCDSLSVEKLLSQFLITDELRILFNDLDSAQIVTNSSVICGSSKKKITFSNSYFIPPEQLNFAFYNEKSEIWKVPDICEFFINSSGNKILNYILFDIHKSCKHPLPEKRPSAKWLVKKYKLVLKELF